MVCRIRPANDREKKTVLGVRKCVTADGPRVTVQTKPEPKTFSFDFVADEDVEQKEVFNQVGIPITQACVEGYNGTIICYGQTGSGKTFTMFGPTGAGGVGAGTGTGVSHFD